MGRSFNTRLKELLHKKPYEHRDYHTNVKNGKILHLYQKGKKVNLLDLMFNLVSFNIFLASHESINLLI
jgi:hypothetical protein